MTTPLGKQRWDEQLLGVHPRKCIKHNCLCSVLPRCELLILCSSGPCQHWVVRGSSRAKPRVHEPLQHEPVPPQAHITLLTVHNQLEVGPHKSEWKENPFQTRTSWKHWSPQEQKILNFFPWPAWLLSSLSFIFSLLLSLGATFTLDFVALLLSSLLLEIR